MRALIATILRHWPALAFVTSAAMLAIAHAFETFGHLAPCELCLYERQVYWVALPVAALAFIASQGVSPKVFTPWIGAALALIFLTGAGIAIYHAGAEWKFWPGPSTCSGTSGGPYVVVGQRRVYFKLSAVDEAINRRFKRNALW